MGNDSDLPVRCVFGIPLSEGTQAGTARVDALSCFPAYGNLHAGALYARTVSVPGIAVAFGCFYCLWGSTHLHFLCLADLLASVQ